MRQKKFQKYLQTNLDVIQEEDDSEMDEEKEQSQRENELISVKTKVKVDSIFSAGDESKSPVAPDLFYLGSGGKNQSSQKAASDPLKVYQQVTQVKSEQENKACDLDDLVDSHNSRLDLSELEKVCEVDETPRIALQQS